MIYALESDSKLLKSPWWSQDVEYMKVHANNTARTRGQIFTHAQRLGFYKCIRDTIPDLHENNFRARHDAATSFALIIKHSCETLDGMSPEAVVSMLRNKKKDNGTLLVWKKFNNWIFYWVAGESE